MLRFALLVLLLANAGYLAWSQGWMASLGWAPEVQSEPHRLARQVRPEVVVLHPTPKPPPPVAATPAPATVTAEAPTAADEALLPETPLATPSTQMQTNNVAALPEPSLCLQTDSMDEAQADQVRQALRRTELPASSWEWQNTPISGRWMVYMGKFPNEMALEKRRAELRSRKIGFDRAGGQLEPGLSLGRFSTEEAATRELTQMLKQGIRGARVVQERTPHTLYTLRLPQVTPSQRISLQALQSVLGNKALRTCSG